MSCFHEETLSSTVAFHYQTGCLVEMKSICSIQSKGFLMVHFEHILKSSVIMFTQLISIEKSKQIHKTTYNIFNRYIYTDRHYDNADKVSGAGLKP